MPEGDTIWRVAARLRPALVGHELVRFAAPRLVGPRPAVGTVIESVDAVGKHLLVGFADGIVVQTHLRMTGSWHLYRIGQRWQRPAHQARLEIETAAWVAVCFSAPIVRSERTARRPAAGSTPLAPSSDAPGSAAAIAPATFDAVAHLGPDLTAPDVDLDRIMARLAAQDPQRPLIDVLLDQRVAAGIGNVYKNELLWLQHLAPSVRLGELDEDARRAIYERAHRLLRANLTSAARVTVAGVAGGVAVYRRAGRGCPRCATPIVRGDLGEHRRATFWCPRCQGGSGADRPRRAATP